MHWIQWQMTHQNILAQSVCPQADPPMWIPNINQCVSIRVILFQIGCSIKNETREAVHRATASAKSRGVCFGGHDSFSFCWSTMLENQKVRNCTVYIWLQRSFISSCLESWYGHSYEREQQTTFKYLSYMNHKSSLFTWEEPAFASGSQGVFSPGCWKVLYMVAIETGMDILLKYRSKLLSNTFHIHERNIKALSQSEPEIWLFWIWLPGCSTTSCHGLLFMVPLEVGMYSSETAQ